MSRGKRRPQSRLSSVQCPLSQILTRDAVDAIQKLVPELLQLMIWVREGHQGLRDVTVSFHLHQLPTLSELCSDPSTSLRVCVGYTRSVILGCRAGCVCCFSKPTVSLNYVYRELRYWNTVCGLSIHSGVY